MVGCYCPKSNLCIDMYLYNIYIYTYIFILILISICLFISNLYSYLYLYSYSYLYSYLHMCIYIYIYNSYFTIWDVISGYLCDGSRFLRSPEKDLENKPPCPWTPPADSKAFLTWPSFGGQKLHVDFHGDLLTDWFLGHVKEKRKPWSLPCSLSWQWKILSIDVYIWLVVWTPLKNTQNISQMGLVFPIYGK